MISRVALRLFSVLALGVFLFACSSLESAEPDSPVPTSPGDALTRLFASDEVRPSWFSERAREAGLVETVRELRDSYLDTHGPLRAVREDDDFWLLNFDDAIVPVYALLDGDGAFSLLWFSLSEAVTPPTLEDITGVLSEFDGPVSLYVERDGKVLYQHNPDTPLAVGSAFKLVVLQALLDKQSVGELSPDDTLALEAHQVSLPSGRLHAEPIGSSYTLDALATAMIRDSDNTATDMLIDAVGTPALEALSPRNAPFLRTTEFFKLKNPDNAALLARWREGDVSARRSVIEELGPRPLPLPTLFNGGPQAIDVEWFVTVKELCGHLKAVSFLPATTARTAHIDPTPWSQVAYKGGFEPGVFNQSYLLEDAEGRISCVVGSWNREGGLSTFPFMRLMSHLVRVAREHP